MLLNTTHPIFSRHKQYFLESSIAPLWVWYCERNGLIILNKILTYKHGPDIWYRPTEKEHGLRCSIQLVPKYAPNPRCQKKIKHTTQGWRTHRLHSWLGPVDNIFSHVTCNMYCLDILPNFTQVFHRDDLQMCCSVFFILYKNEKKYINCPKQLDMSTMKHWREQQASVRKTINSQAVTSKHLLS